MPASCTQVKRVTSVLPVCGSTSTSTILPAKEPPPTPMPPALRLAVPTMGPPVPPSWPARSLKLMLSSGSLADWNTPSFSSMESAFDIPDGRGALYQLLLDIEGCVVGCPAGGVCGAAAAGYGGEAYRVGVHDGRAHILGRECRELPPPAWRWTRGCHRCRSSLRPA